MNFFQAQDNARRKTWQLGMLFGAAVVTLIILTNLLVAIALGWTGTQAGMTFAQTMANIPLDSWLWISFGVLGIVGVASAYKYLSLQGGGRTIAESLGGQLIHQSTRNHQQRVLLNVVEEMAIASGIPVPPVYLIPEPSINAFAAGFSADDAVIGINQGTLDLLNRSELQGVVAHEFSHILNGDTNINLRLIALLHGILFIGMIGYGLLRAGGYSRKNGLPVIALGAGLLAIGYGGTFFGNLIKAAVSRQREFLADASAVQFTRDPEGIADALKRIGGSTMSSHMLNPKAEQASHMFFGAAAQKFASSMMATHPPLDKRIRAIQPNWDGRFLQAQVAGSASQVPASSTASNSAFAPSPSNTGSASLSSSASSASEVASAASGPMSADDIVAQVGTTTAAGLAQAQAFIAANPAALKQAAHDPFEARALIYASLIDPQADIAAKQHALLAQQAEPAVLPHVDRLLPLVQTISHVDLLSLIDMSMPALKELSYDQYKRFSANTAALITLDNHIDIFEWVLHRVVVKELYPHFEGPQNYHGRIKSISRVSDEAAKLISILACAGHSDLDEQLKAYNAGAQQLGLEQPLAKQQGFDYQRMNQALAQLRKLKPLVKPALIKACVLTVQADEHISADEAALLKGIAATLDCPLPPTIYTN